ncbi:maleate cis-trans isomerase [Halococcus dombrowskii]|uniref:Aspartate/glutamate racemase family protein n=1 Tax=Halococcus dombrowskii TaxID=179637 RepID=A0AAV3SEU7_HALDO|nr:maleate cis-trans isomerase [Halococcus dombrowskii]UOO95019.1 maleate cis-trans isomerase [Halococcus dombrowskii]
MTGWRARLGLIVPSSNTTAEPELTTACPAGTSVHAARMPLEDVTADDLDAMADRTIECAELLAHADVDVVAYGCTTGSLLHGHGFDAELEAEIATTADCPAVATALSVERALDALDCRRIALATPYVDDLTQREVAYLEESGREVVAVDGLDITANTDIGALTPEDAYRQVDTLLADADDPDGVFVSCTNYPSLSVVETLEADFGLPVVTSNAATLWDALRTVDVDTAGSGQLFARGR